MAQIDTGVGATARWEARAISINASGFIMFVYSSDATSDTWTDIPVSYMALYRA
jgi:hypothetical protein